MLHMLHTVHISKHFTFTFSRRFYPKRLTRMYTHFLHFTLMAHCTSGAIRGSVSCSRTLRQGIELATFCLLNDFFTYCTTVAPRISSPFQIKEILNVVIKESLVTPCAVRKVPNQARRSGLLPASCLL